MLEKSRYITNLDGINVKPVLKTNLLPLIKKTEHSLNF